MDWAEDDADLATSDPGRGPGRAGRGRRAVRAGRFRRILADELARSPRQVGRLGRGVRSATSRSVYGLDLDLVVVVGMAGFVPPRHRDDPLRSRAQ